MSLQQKVLGLLKEESGSFVLAQSPTSGITYLFISGKTLEGKPTPENLRKLTTTVASSNALAYVIDFDRLYKVCESMRDTGATLTDISRVYEFLRRGVTSKGDLDIMKLATAIEKLTTKKQLRTVFSLAMRTANKEGLDNLGIKYLGE